MPEQNLNFFLIRSFFKYVLILVVFFEIIAADSVKKFLTIISTPPIIKLT